MDFIILDTNYSKVGIVDIIKSSIWTDRFWEYGDFEFYTPISIDLLNLLKKDYYVQCDNSEHTMIIETINVTTSSDEGNILKIVGRSLESILERRIIWGQQTFTGNIQEVIKKMITDAFIDPSIEDRKIGGFIFLETTDPKITSITINPTQYIGDDLYTVISELCQANNIGFKLVLEDGNFIFSLYSGIDRSYDQFKNNVVIFSNDYENIINGYYTEDKTTFKNVAYVEGEGKGTNKKSVTVGSSIGIDRREIYCDGTSLSKTEKITYIDDDGIEQEQEVTYTDEQYLSILTQKGYSELENYKEDIEFEGKMETTKMFVYPDDFNIGDIVEVSDAYGHSGKATIKEIIFSQSNEDTSTYPTFCMLPKDPLYLYRAGEGAKYEYSTYNQVNASIDVGTDVITVSSINFNSNYGVGFQYNSYVDVTEYNKFVIEAKCMNRPTSDFLALKLMISKSPWVPSNNIISEVTTSLIKNFTRQKYVIDISKLQGEYYIGFKGGANATIYNIYLE